jgi:hypothetical protein
MQASTPPPELTMAAVVSSLRRSGDHLGVLVA